MYTVDPATKQYIPLDKAAAQALKAQTDAEGAGGIPGRGLGLEVRAKTAQAALDAPIDPHWAPEDRRFKEQAKKLISSLAK